MSTSRRTILASLAGLGVTAAVPAWAQAIGAQSDPWAQVDPYADPRNGFPSERQSRGREVSPSQPPDSVFDSRRQSATAMAGYDESAEIADALAAYGPKIQQDGGAHPDRRVQQAMTDFCRPFIRVCDRPHLPWQVTAVHQGVVNAWAMGGGKMAFYGGLIALTDHPGELAAVVCHEIGHVDLGHSARHMQTAKTAMMAERAGFDMKGSVPMDVLVDGAGAAGINSVFALLMTAITREDEDAADEHSVGLMRKAGMDPRWAAAMFRKLERLEGGAGPVNDLLLDHARPGDRVAHIERLVALSPNGQHADFTPPGWAVLKSAYPTPPQFRNS